MYARSPTKLAPESLHLNAGTTEIATNTGFTFTMLRPEAVEAWYYLHYYTGDPKYRQWAHEYLAAMNKYARAEFGFSELSDVNQVPPRKSGKCESFVLAETLKFQESFFLKNKFGPWQADTKNRNILSINMWVLGICTSSRRIVLCMICRSLSSTQKLTLSAFSTKISIQFKFSLLSEFGFKVINKFNIVSNFLNFEIYMLGFQFLSIAPIKFPLNPFLKSDSINI